MQVNIPYMDRVGYDGYDMITPPKFNSQFAPEKMMEGKFSETMFNFRSIIITAFHYLHILNVHSIYITLQKFSSGNLHVHATFIKRFKEKRRPFRNRLEINPPETKSQSP